MKRIILIALSLAVLILSGCDQNIDNISENEILGEDIASGEDIPSVSEHTDNGSSDTIPFPEVDLKDEISTTPEVISDDATTITQSGTYEFTGDYLSSTITVNVNKETDEGTVYLVLNNANIESETDTPINIIEAKDVVIVLEGENSVTQGEIITTDEEFPSGAIHSKADTVITGDGSLIVNTLYMDGINSRDDLIIEGGNITVNAVEHGIEGKDLLAIDNATINITSGRDGIRTSNDEDLEKGNLIITSGKIIINAQHDGIVAEQTLQIDGGSFDITTGGGFVEVLNEITRGEGSSGVSATDLLEDSMRSLKGTSITINDGEFVLSSYEDTIHANGVLTINGGVFDIISGDDALHADTDLVINNGDILVQNGYEGIEGETVTINGGNINITVLDDAVNANSDDGFIRFTGGIIHLSCRGDGIDSNGDLIIEGGDIVVDVDAIYSGGDGEIDVTGTYTISGGSIVDENGNELSSNTSGNNPGGGMQPNNNQGGGMQPNNNQGGGMQPNNNQGGGMQPNNNQGGGRPRG